jgi:hypothetical protein
MAEAISRRGNQLLAILFAAALQGTFSEAENHAHHKEEVKPTAAAGQPAKYWPYSCWYGDDALRPEYIGGVAAQKVEQRITGEEAAEDWIPADRVDHIIPNELQERLPRPLRLDQEKSKIAHLLYRDLIAHKALVDWLQGDLTKVLGYGAEF